MNIAEFSGISCASASYCIAVGDSLTGSSFATLAERWNGSTWTNQTAPGTWLRSVSCTSSSFCEAVGVGSAAVWNGSSWTAQTIATANSADYESVSCASASSCVAVGTTFNSTTGTFNGAAEYWNGSTWAAQTFAQPTSDTEPFGVSCTSATSCMAVGYYVVIRTGASFPLAEYWNGTSWTTQTPAISGSALDSVSCVSATSCTAAGSTGSTLAEHWDGSTWTVQTTPNPAGAQTVALDGISCPTATDCSAAGAWNTMTNNNRTLAEQWTG